jgi:hypothetical protein
VDYTTIDQELQKLAQVQVILQHLEKYHLSSLDQRMQRELKQAVLDMADIRPRIVKYMAHYFADQVMAQAKADVENKLNADHEKGIQL